MSFWTFCDRNAGWIVLVILCVTTCGTERVCGRCHAHVGPSAASSGPGAP